MMNDAAGGDPVLQAFPARRGAAGGRTWNAGVWLLQAALVAIAVLWVITGDTQTPMLVSYASVIVGALAAAAMVDRWRFAETGILPVVIEVLHPDAGIYIPEEAVASLLGGPPSLPMLPAPVLHRIPVG